MAKTLSNIILLGLALFLVYNFRVPLEAKFSPAWNTVKSYILYSEPCEEPIPYSLGEFDTEFKISTEYFLKAIADAEAIWEEPSKKDLFVYAPTDTSYDNLKINLMYDYRQQATSALSTLGVVVEDTKESYDALKVKFTSAKTQYENEKASLNVAIDIFNAKSAAYEAEVSRWNKEGGAPESEYQKLQKTRAELESEQKVLKTREANLAKKADEINAMVVVLNRLASNLNLTVEKYNNVNEARGESFEEGVYYSEGLKRAIDIYEFEDRNKLVRVLAHELGHALGIEHVPDSKAIMYEYNHGTGMALTQADLSALEMACQN